MLKKRRKPKTIKSYGSKKRLIECLPTLKVQGVDWARGSGIIRQGDALTTLARKLVKEQALTAEPTLIIFKSSRRTQEDCRYVWYPGIGLFDYKYVLANLAEFPKIKNPPLLGISLSFLFKNGSFIEEL